MDARITKQRFSRFWSYEWLKLIASTLALVLFWIVLLISVETKPKTGQDFLFFTYEDLTAKDEFNELATAVETQDIFSYEVQRYTSLDLTAGFSSFTLGARFATGRGNLVLTSEYGSPSFVYSYSEMMKELDAYFSDCEAYLNGYYHGDFRGGTLDSALLEARFRERMQGDKRYKKESQIRNGIADETARILALRENYLAIEGYLEAGILSIRDVRVPLDEEGKETIGGRYALQANKARLRNLNRLASVVAYDEDGERLPEDVCFEFFFIPWAAQAPDLQWEALGLVRYLVNRYLDT